MEKHAQVTVALVFGALLLASGLGYYFATATLRPTTTTQQKSGPFQMTLLEPTDVAWNATTGQPRFYVVGSSGLESSASIAFPINTLIQLTIISYDAPTGGPPQIGVVKGTVGGVVYMINGTNPAGPDPAKLGQNVTSVPDDSVAHTFTIPDLNVNIPVVGGYTEMAYLYFTKAGTYQWLCMTPCGLGTDGSTGAMSTAGWMTGTVTVA
ncbi:MAG: hypothetical protein JRM80_04380 [Nitrososphaerota archaeon]|nr:hypothetical protein [Nitrososphaerota archaeon]